MSSRFSVGRWVADRSLATKVVLANLLVLAPAVAILVFYLDTTTRSNTVAQGVSNAQRTIEQYKLLRGYYTDKVVAKVVKNTSLQVSFDHQGHSDTIPLPATMIQDMSQLYEAEHLAVQLKL